MKLIDLLRVLNFNDSNTLYIYTSIVIEGAKCRNKLEGMYYNLEDIENKYLNMKVKTIDIGDYDIYVSLEKILVNNEGVK